jgi:hypothetical protein
MKTIVREYEDWTFHAAEVTINGMQIVYGRSKSKNGKVNETLETYSGYNYIIGSSSNSYSRKYDIDKIPAIHSNTKLILEQFLIQELGDKLLKI